MSNPTSSLYKGFRFDNRSVADTCTIYQLAESPPPSGRRKSKDGYGTGEMCCFDIADGILLSYNELNMESCFQEIAPKRDCLQIDYCLEGCYEFELENGTVSFLAEGNVCVTDLSTQIFTGSRLPLRHYKGITILLEVEKAQAGLQPLFPQLDISELRDSLCTNGQSALIPAENRIGNIVNAMYEIDPRIQIPLLLIKIIELLMQLTVHSPDHTWEQPSFSYAVSESTKAAYQYLLEHPFSQLTIEDLALKFQVAQSSLKRCFKSLTGQSVGNFMKNKRIEAAAVLLAKQKDRNIGDIADMAGYKNQSKFSAAFKSVMGETPFSYRRKC